MRDFQRKKELLTEMIYLFDFPDKGGRAGIDRWYNQLSKQDQRLIQPAYNFISKQRIFDLKIIQNELSRTLGIRAS